MQHVNAHEEPTAALPVLVTGFLVTPNGISNPGFTLQVLSAPVSILPGFVKTPNVASGFCPASLKCPICKIPGPRRLERQVHVRGDPTGIGYIVQPGQHRRQLGDLIKWSSGDSTAHLRNCQSGLSDMHRSVSCIPLLFVHPISELCRFTG
ncbi:hypothetical protein PAXRUDRAFT_826560 [Paxillus rubicundulus Ve08.2h10]|uniref:Uncharacterized protein n=1 Tax=Paxillus rubicundulus Ve08.2h10 TaxID=930991 RepID=A0A0D0DEF6_9AGAM|nr:hypothetical protein PAXRUDRAFT_826560 [Paxillus rubicundulus Ve08.2h10]